MRVLKSNQQYIELDFTVKYNTENPPTVDDVIKSLGSLKVLLKSSSKLLDLAYTEFEVVSAEVFVRDIEAGSLIEKLMVRVLVNLIGEENISKIKEVFDDITKDKTKMNALLAAGLSAYVGYSIGAYVESKTSDSVQPIQTYADNSVNIFVAGSDVGMTGDQVADVIKTMVDKSSAASSVDFIQPAKSESDATISVGDNEELTIPVEFVKATPKKADLKPPETELKHIASAKIYLHASNQNSDKSGWGGLIPEHHPSGVKFKIGEQISPENLHMNPKRDFNADVTMVNRYDKTSRSYKLDHVIINSIRS